MDTSLTERTEPALLRSGEMSAQAAAGRRAKTGCADQGGDNQAAGAAHAQSRQFLAVQSATTAAWSVAASSRTVGDSAQEASDD